MLVLLPLQWGWAAAAAYCLHEAAPERAAHLGHHEHQHQAADAPDAAGQGDLAAPGSDMDCGICHGVGASMPHPVAAPPASILEARMAPRPSPPVKGIAQTPPERPQWALPA